MKHWKLWTILLLTALSLSIGTRLVWAQTPAPGSSPWDAIRVTNDTQTLAPGQMRWHYFDYTGDRTKTEVGLRGVEWSTDNPPDVRMSIYTPQQIVQWFDNTGVTPIGQGSKPAENTLYFGRYDLAWQGAFNFAGRFAIVVTNYSKTPIKYRLTATGESLILYPTPTPTAVPTTPFSTPIPVGTIQGRLVFQQWSGGRIFTVNGDGSNIKAITNGLDPNWSPDGKMITFTRWEGAPGVYIANADGSNAVSLMGMNQALSPQWSPDGRFIAFTRPSGGSQNDSQFCFGRFCFSQLADPHWKLGIIEIGKWVDADKAINELTNPPCSDHCFSPTWSKDGRYLAYADAGVGIVSTDVTTKTVWTMYNAIPKVQAAAWSPDGTKIAFQVNQHDHWEVAVMNSDATGVTGVTRADPLSFQQVNNVAPAWSPDSKEIIFLSDRNGRWEFFAVNVDGTNLRQVLKNVTDAYPITYNYSNERVISWTK